MFPEGHGRVRAFPRAGGVAPLINALLVNAKSAIDTLWKQRGYIKMTPDQIKARLGYRLDREEGVGYLVTSSLGMWVDADWTRAIGKRVGNAFGPKAALGKALKRGPPGPELLLAPGRLPTGSCSREHRAASADAFVAR